MKEQHVKRAKVSLTENVPIPEKYLRHGRLDGKIAVIACHKPLTVVYTTNTTPEHIEHIKQRMQILLHIRKP